MDCSKIFLTTTIVELPQAGRDERMVENYSYSPVFHHTIRFSDEINSVSSTFELIYGQASQAEELMLDQIAGMGYRRALEFLIKDYCSRGKPADIVEKIRGKFLGQVIAQDVANEAVKECASMATYLGNDETHYVRKWETMDIKDLKLLIELVVTAIEAEIRAENYKNKFSCKGQ